MAAAATAARVVKNSASLIAVGFLDLGERPLTLLGLLAAGAASGLAAHLRKLTGVRVATDCAVQQLQALRQCASLTHLGISGTALQDCSAEQGHQAVLRLGAALQGMRSLTCLQLGIW